MKTTYTTGQPALGADQSPYARLYQAVIFRAVQDLTRKQHRSEARKWLLSSDSDYAFVTAGISSDAIRRPMTEIGKTKHREVVATRIGVD